jgi:hypothetical protein
MRPPFAFPSARHRLLRAPSQPASHLIIQCQQQQQHIHQLESIFCVHIEGRKRGCCSLFYYPTKYDTVSRWHTQETRPQTTGTAKTRLALWPDRPDEQEQWVKGNRSGCQDVVLDSKPTKCGIPRAPNLPSRLGQAVQSLSPTRTRTGLGDDAYHRIASPRRRRTTWT